jgi:hypothetical protein
MQMSLRNASDIFSATPRFLKSQWFASAIPQTFILQCGNTQRMLSFYRLLLMFPRIAAAIACPDINSVYWKQGKHILIVKKLDS